MPKPKKRTDLRDFFSLAEGRRDRWSLLNDRARTWAQVRSRAAEKVKGEAVGLLSEIIPLEGFYAYPGSRVLGILKERLNDDNAEGFAHLTQKILTALLSESFRRETAAWDTDEEAETAAGDRLEAYFGKMDAHRPYFEVLSVTPSPPGNWEKNRQEVRRLRRPEDPFIYELVQAGNFEDAVAAVIVNANLQAVALYDGFGYRSPLDMPLLKEQLARHLKIDLNEVAPRHLGLTLAQVIKHLRPEIDIYLLADRDVEELAGSEGTTAIRRIFYDLEELMEIHLSILEGINQRYDTPYFSNLKRYSQRPVGTFHALPVARGKSIFKSNWIRDMGHFYGINLFLAESSATTGGLDSLLEPTGNIKEAQDKAARAFGAQKAFFATNGTSTSNKIVVQALSRPGDIVLVDRNCHKSHHYGFILSGAQPLYLEAYPLTAYSMYGAVPLRTIKKALLDLQAEGKLDRARMVDLTNCTFDGHMYNPRQVMEECLAIKPDLIFLWDEAWFGFARFSLFHRPRTAMAAAAALEARYRDPAYRQEYEAFKAQFGSFDPADPALLDRHLLPDPDRVRIRVYHTHSTHKSMSALRQGSMILVYDQDFHQVEEAFHEAYFTHTSTSPNLQIIASLDVARRQMELEGYDLVMKASELAFDIRREVNSHPLLSKYFRILSNGEMVPRELRASGIADYGPPDSAWTDVLEAWREDEFALDPTRMTLVCGTAGYDGTAFKNLLAEEYDIQLNKTSRNSILLQTNINNNRSDAAHLIKVLADLARKIDRRLDEGGAEVRAAFQSRVQSLMTDVPDLPNFSRFHDAFRDNPQSATQEGHMREAFYLAYRAEHCEHVKLRGPEMDERLEKGPELVSANLVIPYPPGFPIMVPGQVITRETVEFMRKLDVKEIHGYNAAEGLKVFKSEVLVPKAAA
ncbi:MAG: decarboxylase [Desulfobacterota bacterium]|nr:decarboxylase [Thermodesulfobacteriota bacterium]